MTLPTSSAEDIGSAQSQPGYDGFAASAGAEPSALADLLARVEAATGPDRELDAALWLDFTPGATRRASTVKSSKGLWPDYTIDETREAGGALIVVPAYTASLDATLALVERCKPEWSGLIHLSIAGSSQAVIEARDPCDLRYAQAFGHTPALALLAALLRALGSRPLEAAAPASQVPGTTSTLPPQDKEQ